VSDENVQFVKDLYAGAEGMDKEELLAVLPAMIEQICDPDIEWAEDPQRADSQIHRGHAGVLRSFEQWLEGFDEYGFSAERIVGNGEIVYVEAREQARGSASGASISAQMFQVLTVRNQKVVRFQEFYDEAAALKAAGMSE
jgi:ketosteroid isomerase-like protein